RELSGDATLSFRDIAINADTLTNVRLWDHQPLLDTFGQLQEIRPYYDFSSVDNDRYVINGVYRQVMLSARELNSQELSNDYVFVGTSAPEFDYPRGDDNVTSHYQGRGGVAVDSFWRKLLFASRFRSQQVLFSNDLGPGTRVLYHRRIDERLERIAPFLR